MQPIHHLFSANTLTAREFSSSVEQMEPPTSWHGMTEGQHMDFA
jgi:hypothetical protein